MKVLHILNIGYEAGGAEISVKFISDSIKRRGHEVLVLATDRDIDGKCVFADATVPTVCGGPLARLAKYFWNHEVYRTVRAVIRDFHPDIIHMHTISEFSPSIVWGIGRTPAILTVHGADEFTLKLLPWLLPRSDYRHGAYKWEDLRLIGLLRYAYLRYVQRPAYLLAFKRLKLVVAPSKFMSRAIAPDFPNTPILHVYNGIVLPPKPHFHALPTRPRYMSAGWKQSREWTI